MNNQLQNTKIAKRIVTHEMISKKLAVLSDQELTNLINDAKSIGTSIGGTTALLTIDHMNIFIKKVRLTDIERLPENMLSTANVFDLPFYYQYGLGSAGFGVWRELAIHTLSTQWVLNGECANFPMLYHWRLLPTAVTPPTTEELSKLESRVEFWAGSPEVRTRLLANINSSAEIILFLEYIPENLNQWLSKQISNGDSATESACKMVEENLKSVTSFINSRGLLHFDLHFFNILTDGDCLYFADFGLAMSSQFDLREDELDFFKKHHNYDLSYSMAYFIEWLLANLFGMEDWVIGNDNPILLEYAQGKGKPLPPCIESIVMRYLPFAVLMNEFFRKLKKSKTTPYPVNKLECLWATVDE